MRRCWCEHPLPEQRAKKKKKTSQCCVLIASPDALAVCKTTVVMFPLHLSHNSSSIPDRKKGSRLFDVERMQMKEEWRNNQKRWDEQEEKWVSGNMRGEFLFSVYVCIRWKKTCKWVVESLAARSDEYMHGCEPSLCWEKPTGKYK